MGETSELSNSWSPCVGEGRTPHAWTDNETRWAFAGSPLGVAGVTALILLFDWEWHVLAVAILVIAGSWTDLLLSRRTRRKSRPTDT